MNKNSKRQLLKISPLLSTFFAPTLRFRKKKLLRFHTEYLLHILHEIQEVFWKVRVLVRGADYIDKDVTNSNLFYLTLCCQKRLGTFF